MGNDLPSRHIHRRSRYGCKQCKLRRVKCDQGRPACSKCLKYGVNCVYVTGNPAELMSKGESVISNTRLASDVATAGLVSTIAQATGLESTYNPRNARYANHLGMLFRNFQSSTVLSLGSPPIVAVYYKEIGRLALNHTYLMHTVLALSALHKRALVDDRKISVGELEQLQGAVSLFNQVITHPIRDSERDAIFATATLLNTLFMANVESDDPLQSWPMKSGTPSLRWLRLQAGVALTIRATDPVRPGGLFADLFKYVEREQMSDWKPLGDIFYARYTNLAPYVPGIKLLAPLIHTECTEASVMFFLPFIGYMSREFIELLEQKDDLALLMLGIWFGLVSQCGQWWLARRAATEFKSIEIYLTSRKALLPSQVIHQMKSLKQPEF